MTKSNRAELRAEVLRQLEDKRAAEAARQAELKSAPLGRKKSRMSASQRRRALAQQQVAAEN